MGDPWAARRNPPSHKDTRISGSLEFCKQTRPGLGWCIWPQGATVRSIGGFNPKGKFDCWEHEDLPANLGGSLFSGEKKHDFSQKENEEALLLSSWSTVIEILKHENDLLNISREPFTTLGEQHILFDSSSKQENPMDNELPRRQCSRFSHVANGVPQHWLWSLQEHR